MFLKRYEGDVADLGLTFTITDNVLGRAQEVSCRCWVGPRHSASPRVLAEYSHGPA